MEAARNAALSELQAFAAKLGEVLGIGIAGTTLLCMYWFARTKYAEIPDALQLGVLLTIAAGPSIWLIALREPGLSETPPLRILALGSLALAWAVPWLVLAL